MLISFELEEAYGTLQEFYKKWKDTKFEGAAQFVDDCVKLFKEHPSPEFHSVGDTFKNWKKR